MPIDPLDLIPYVLREEDLIYGAQTPGRKVIKETLAKAGHVERDEFGFIKEFRSYDLDSDGFNSKYSNLRERLLEGQASRIKSLRASYLDGALKPDELGRLSPSLRRTITSSEGFSDAILRNRDAISRVKQQTAAERAEAEAFEQLSPLERVNRAPRRFRSLRDRETAIAGMLERERKKSAPLTREAFARAKATAAARRRDSLNREAIGASARVGRRGSAIEKDLVEEGSLCDWWHQRKRKRREVWFAKKLKARRPYLVRKARREVKNFVLEALCG